MLLEMHLAKLIECDKCGARFCKFICINAGESSAAMIMLYVAYKCIFKGIFECFR